MSLWNDLLDDRAFMAAVEGAIRRRIESISDAMAVPTGGEEAVSLSGASGIDFEFGSVSPDELTVSVEIVGQALATARWMDGGNDAQEEEREVDIQLSGFLSITFPHDVITLALDDIATQAEIDTDDLVVDVELEREDLDDFDDAQGE